MNSRTLAPVIAVALLASTASSGFSETPSPAGAELKSLVDYFPPTEANGGWRKNTGPKFIRSLGLDPGKLEEFGQYNLSVPNNRWYPYAKYKGILVIKDGWVVGEWCNTPEATTFESYLSSNGKSFAMVLVGIMMEDGAAGKIDHKIGPKSKVYDRRWLPQGFPLSDSRKHFITFEQIFQHTSGLCPERTSSGEDVEKGRNAWADYVDWVVGHDKKWSQTAKLYFRPGHPEEYAGSEKRGKHSYAYSSVSMAHLGVVFQNVYQMPAREFLWKRLLEPIGFRGVDFHQPPNGEIHWFSAGGLRMTPRDYARFAYFLSRDGRWGERQLASRAWIQRFRTSGCYANILSNSEGALGEEYPKDMFRIAGSGLNWAFIVLSLDLIAVRTGRADNSMWNQVRGEFLEKLFAAIPNTVGATWGGEKVSDKPPRLPEGDGIAAKFPGDRGIERCPAVIFADGFENSFSLSDLRGKWNWIIHEGNMRITERADDVNGGKKSLAFTVPRQRTALAIGVAKRLKKERDTLFLRWYSKFEDGFAVLDGSVHNGGSISAHYYKDGRATPGTRADGRNKFLANFENENSSGKSPGKLNVYCYHAEQGGDYGDHFFPSGKVLPFSHNRSGAATFGPFFLARPDIIPENGRWYCYEFMVKANTPGRRDGRIACWLDGRLVADFPNLRLRDDDNLKIDRFDIGLYIANSAARANTKWYDDVVAATAYVGPRVAATWE